MKSALFKMSQESDDMSPENSNLEEIRSQMEYILQNVLVMTELAMDMKEKCTQGEKYVCYLRSMATRVTKNVRSLQQTGNQFLILAQRAINGALSSMDSDSHTVNNVKLEFERLLSVVEIELAELDELDNLELHPKSTNTAERIHYLENKQKQTENMSNVQQSVSVKSVKSDVDEKYPENWSRDSLIDLNNVVNLPPVPEDIFTCFANKPTRTSSLSSLKGMRKVKLFLQRAANNSDDEDSSDMEDHEAGDADDKSAKKQLGNIKEETQQD